MSSKTPFPHSRHLLLVVLLFAAGAVLSTLLLFAADRTFPVYASGSPIPASMDTPMILTGAESLDEQTAMVVFQSDSPVSDLAVLISNAAMVTAKQDSVKIYESNEESTYSRAQMIPLHPFQGTSRLSISWNTNNPSVLPVRHMLLGRPEDFSARIHWAELLSALVFGVLVMIAMMCFVLYHYKHSETYLLHVVICSLISLCNIAVTYLPGLLPASYRITTHLRSGFLCLCPLQFLLITVSYFRYGKFDKILSWLERLALAAALLAAIGALPGNLAFFFRFPYIYCILVLLARQWENGKGREVIPIVLACSVTEGFSYASFAAAAYLHYGAVFGFHRVMELAHTIFLFPVALLAAHKFALQYGKAEQLSSELESINKNLEEKVAERTQAVISQQQKRQITMQNIFHDLRSPVFVLKSLVDQLPEDTENKAGIVQRLSYMSRLIEDLFLVSNLESNNVLLEEDDVDINALINELVKAKAAAVKQEIQVQCVPGPCFVWGDSMRLQQVFENLLVNAEKHVSEHGIIRVTTRTCGEEVIVEVFNTGIPIDKEEIDRIFERYYRSRRRHDPSSSGLGLAIAKEIVTLHGGRISVEAKEDGTLFTVFLPLLSCGPEE